MMRSHNRDWADLRPIKVEIDFMSYAEGSVLFQMGNTKVICTASVEENVPPFLRDSGKGWITAEYSLLPRSTHTRTPRESVMGRIGGRTHEIQRLIGRSLRAVTDLDIIGERTVWIDCDVIQADGGTRTAAITGACIALSLAFSKMQEKELIEKNPLREFVAAVSVGIVDGKILLDLDYQEDSHAEVDCNFVITESQKLVEVQGTAEGNPFSKEEFIEMLSIAEIGIRKLIEIQKNTIKER